MYFVIVILVLYYDDGGDGIVMVGVMGEGVVLIYGFFFDCYFNGVGDFISVVFIVGLVKGELLDVMFGKVVGVVYIVFECIVVYFGDELDWWFEDVVV